MKKFFTLLSLLAFLVQNNCEAQRYLESVFEEVSITENIVYGVNATALFLASEEGAVPEPLLLDLYQAVGDTETERPLVLLFHSGSFLPPSLTGGFIGTKKDSALVYIATELAKRGYVVASCDYRLGWNPTALNQDPLLFGIMNAAYRGIQDSRNAVRFFKYTHEEEGNIYGIDPCKIVVWGNGTGGFLSLGAASLDNYIEEIAMVPKFYVGGAPVVHPDLNGNVYGTSLGIVPDPAPPGYPFPANDTLCYINYPEYSSDFQLAVNMSGAVGDSSWVDENTVSTISFHVKSDSSTLCGTGTVISAFNIPIIEVSGSCVYQSKQQEYNNQEEWYDFDWNSFIWPEDMKLVADTRNDGLEGFFPFETSSSEINTPWNWWAEDYPSPPWPLDPEMAKATIDSALAYFAPRACITLGLGCGFTDEEPGNCIITDISEIKARTINLTAFPNPASNSVHFETKEFLMERILLFDLRGQLVRTQASINSSEYELQRKGLGNGVYFAQVWFESGFLCKQIVFQE